MDRTTRLMRQHIGRPLGAERRASGRTACVADDGENFSNERRGGAVKVFDSSWPTFAVRAAVLGGVVFGAVRFAVARDGVAGGPARSSVTVAGTLTGVTGTATARFRFYDSRTGGTLLCESSRPVEPGPFSVEVPLEGTGTSGPRCITMFDGADVFVEVAVNSITIGERTFISPVPYAHFASVAGQYGTPDCPVGYERATDPAFTGDMRLCQRSRLEGGARVVYDEVVRVGMGASAFWIDRYEASVWQQPDGTGARYPATGPMQWPSSFPRSGQWTTRLYSVSRRAVDPSGSVSWFQAQWACRASGKRLPTGEEWLAAAHGTPDLLAGSDGLDGACITTGSRSRQTGRGSRCVSREWGAEDMIGNLREWTADWHASLGSSRVSPFPRGDWPEDFGGGDGTANIVSAATAGAEGWVVGLPAAEVRGGDWNIGGGDPARRNGIFYLDLSQAPSADAPSIGFRCAIPR